MEKEQILSIRCRIDSIPITRGHVWVVGVVKEFVKGVRLVIDDGTGTLSIDLTPEGLIKGDIMQSSIVRVIGEPMHTTSNQVTIKPLVIQNLDMLGVNKDLLDSLSIIEQKFEGDT